MSRRTEKNVGIIGLGIIGQRVAESARRAGFQVFVWNRTPRPFPNFVGAPAEIAELCDYIQIFVSDDEALIEMVQQMKPSLKAHHVVMAHSTVAPHTMREAAEIVNRRGAQLLDAPFTGSKDAAAKGELVYYIGGDEAAYRRARPVLQASSKEIIEIGEIGQATTIKIATNMITAATVQVAAEALALVHNAGLPLEKFAEAMRGNGSNSGTLTMKLPKMLEGNFEPHFSVKHMLKDVQIASRLARAYGLNLSATEAARDSLVAEARSGRGDYDYSSLVRGFFPDGTPGAFGSATGSEEQATLSGLEHQDSAESAPETETWESQPASQEEGAPPAESESTAKAEDSPADEAPRDHETVEPTPDLNTKANGEVVAAVVETDSGLMVEPETRVAILPAVSPPEAEESRGFLSRLFGKGADY